MEMVKCITVAEGIVTNEVDYSHLWVAAYLLSVMRENVKCGGIIPDVDRIALEKLYDFKLNSDALFIKNGSGQFKTDEEHINYIADKYKEPYDKDMYNKVYNSPYRKETTWLVDAVNMLGVFTLRYSDMWRFIDREEDGEYEVEVDYRDWRTSFMSQIQFQLEKYSSYIELLEDFIARHSADKDIGFARTLWAQLQHYYGYIKVIYNNGNDYGKVRNTFFDLELPF